MRPGPIFYTYKGLDSNAVVGLCSLWLRQAARRMRGFIMVGVQYVSMKEDELTFDEYRTGYIAEKYGVTDNAARALQLFELGFTISGAAKHLPVTESTVRKYHKNLMDNIHKNIVFSLDGAGRDGSFDVWGDRDISDYGNLGYNDGVADAQASTVQVTDRKEQIDPEFREPELPRNKGTPIEEIPNELITIEVDV